MKGFRRLEHSLSDASQTLLRLFTTVESYFGSRPFLFLSEDLNTRFNSLMAAFRCILVVFVNSSNILPFSSFDAFPYRPRIASKYSLILCCVTPTSFTMVFGNTYYESTPSPSVTFIMSQCG